MCFIKKGESYQILSNGFVVYKNKSYPLSECTFEDASPNASSVQEIEIDPNEVIPSEVKKEKSDSKKEQKPKKEKKVAQNHHQDEQGANDQPNEEPSSQQVKMESDMPPIPQAQQPATQNLNVMVPNAQQVLTPQQLLQLQQLQLQYQQQQMLQQQTAQPSIPTPIAPTTAQAPAVTTEKTQSEIHIPEELKMLQDFMHMTGGNVFVAAALVAAALFYKQWKAKNDGKTDNSQLDAHTTACDLERKDLASKLAGLDSKAQKINELENRLGALEEDSERDINLGFSDEIEERLNSIEKQLKELGKAYSSFERRISTAKEPAVPNEVEASDNTSTVKRGRKPSTSK